MISFFYVKIIKRFVQDPAYVMDMFKEMIKSMLRRDE